MNDDRNLTDADVDAIVDATLKRLQSDFYGEIGKGLFGLIKKAILPLALLLAVYGMAQDKAFLAAMAAGK